MHNIEIQQSRVTSEDITPQYYRYEYPKMRRVRVYESGIEPVEPNPFKFAVDATIEESGECLISALANPKDLSRADVQAGFEHLKQFGATKLVWRHNKAPKHFIDHSKIYCCALMLTFLL